MKIKPKVSSDSFEELVLHQKNHGAGLFYDLTGGRKLGIIDDELVNERSRMDTVNLNVGVGLADHIVVQGLSQEEAPNVVVLDVEKKEPQMGVGQVQEDAFQGNTVNLFAGEPPLHDVD
ncbi:hypothetical protein AgCh_017624 [Apium graveolens]